MNKLQKLLICSANNCFLHRKPSWRIKKWLLQAFFQISYEMIHFCPHLWVCTLLTMLIFYFRLVPQDGRPHLKSVTVSTKEIVPWVVIKCFWRWKKTWGWRDRLPGWKWHWEPINKHQVLKIQLARYHNLIWRYIPKFKFGWLIFPKVL